MACSCCRMFDSRLMMLRKYSNVNLVKKNIAFRTLLCNIFALK